MAIELIAECEINHNGDVDLGKSLIDAARKVGADSVKFQCFNPTAFIAPGSPFMPLFENVALTLEDFRALKAHAHAAGIEMFSTAVDIEGLGMIVDLDFAKIKIGSTNITNFGLLEAIAETQRPVYLSTGAATLAEVDRAVSVLSKGTDRITLFHCTALYPAPASELNLLALETLRDSFPGVAIGYSDHSVGTTAAAMATALGITVLEKHFTVDHGLDGPDHGFSADPPQFRALVETVREAEAMRGQRRKQPSDEEQRIRLNGRRYLTTMTGITVGTMLTRNNTRPRRISVDDVDISSLVEAWDEPRVLGWKATRDIDANASITWQDITPA